MIEPVMYLAIGFLVSMLFGLMVLPLVHGRAVRLTTRRLEAATPISMSEIQADKDQLRAEFAMSARRLEMSVEHLKNKTTSQMADIGKKSDAINRMKLELSEKSATIFSLESREKSVRDQLRTTEEEFATKTESLQTAEAALSAKQADLARLTAELADRSMTAETRQVELVAVRNQINMLKSRVGEAEQEFTASRERLEAQRGESDMAARDLVEARSQVGTLTQQVGKLDRQVADQASAAMQFVQRIHELEASLATQTKLLTERNAENVRLLEAEQDLFTTREQLESQRSKFETTARDLVEARSQVGSLTQRTALLDRQVADHTSTATQSVARITELEATLVTQTQSLAERNAENTRLLQVEKDFIVARDQLTALRGTHDIAAYDLADARNQVKNLTQKISELDRQVADQTNAATRSVERIAELETSLTTQIRLLAERTAENAKLRDANDSAIRSADDARKELATTGTGSAKALDLLRTEKTAVDEQLRALTEERNTLQRELTAMQQKAESEWATERMENALLRERINDIAAEVTKLAMTMEGPDSTIETMLAAAPAASLAPSHDPASNDIRPQKRSTLADRIRALQSHASHAREAT